MFRLYEALGGVSLFSLSSMANLIAGFIVQVLSLIPKETDGERFEDALARVCRCIGGGGTTDNADSDSDLEVVAESVTVSLRCPVSSSLVIRYWQNFSFLRLIVYKKI